MEIRRLSDGSIRLDGLDRALLSFLRNVGKAAEWDEGAVRDRLFPSPTAGPARDPEIEADWREYVEPELRHLFRGAIETVLSDLAAAKRSGASYRVEIPAKHIDAWLNGLNQARLALAARHGFDEAAMERELPLAPARPEDLALFQVHFFGYIQGALIELTS